MHNKRVKVARVLCELHDILHAIGGLVCRSSTSPAVVIVDIHLIAFSLCMH